MIVLIEGGEKAGKTTLATELVKVLNLAGKKAVYRHWGPFEPEEFAQVVQGEADDPVVHVWDRGWLSETVYAKLLNRKNHVQDWWLGEYLHGRATTHKYLLLNPLGIKENTPDDLPIDPAAEQREFQIQGCATFKPLYNDYNIYSLATNVGKIHGNLITDTAPPFTYSGRDLANRVPVYFVASPSKMARGTRWMPFSYDRSVEFIRPLGTLAFKCNYMFAHKGNPAALRRAEYIITLGGDAEQWVKYYVGKTNATVFAADMLRANMAHKEAITNLITKIKDTYDGR
jgi:hypothetical protein